jgi:hypothetical protein
MTCNPSEGGTALPSASDLFQCQRCNACCQGYGGTLLSEMDISAIAEFIGIPRQQFMASYCQTSGNRMVIAQAENGYCLFMENGCRIHPVKPRMCRAWPFIPSVVKAPENWWLMASVCPGMRTGFSKAEVAACVSRVLEEAKDPVPGDVPS